MSELKSREKMARDAWVDLDVEDELNDCPGSLNHVAVPKYIADLLRRRDEMVVEWIASHWKDASNLRVRGEFIHRDILAMKEKLL